MKKIVMIALCSASLAACASTERTTYEQQAAFWERSESVSALYLRGPKAQHQLNMDIAACVSEVKELVRLGSIASANPPARIEMNQGLAQGWQNPPRNGPLHTEYRDFHDFESCMNFKGWERSIYVKPEQVEQGQQNYKTTILGETYGLKQEQAPEYNANRTRASGTFNE